MSVAGEAANAAKSVNGYVYEVGNSAVMLGRDRI